MTAVDPDFVRGLLAGFAPGSLAVLNDRQLAALCDWDDPRCVAVLEAEAARREADTGGWSGERTAWLTPLSDAGEMDWAAQAEAAYVAAEAATRGHLLNARGRAAGVDPRDLFHGPRHVGDAYASEELREWWDTHGRLTVTAWRAGLSGHRTAADYLELGA